MERKVEAGLDFRLTLGGGEGAIKIGEEEGKGIRNKEKEKEEEKPEADRNVECKSVDCSLSFQNLQWLLLFPSPVFYSTFPISGLALLSYNFPFIVPLLFHSTLSLFFLFAQLPLSAMVENPLYPVKLVNFLTANGGCRPGWNRSITISFHFFPRCEILTMHYYICYDIVEATFLYSLFLSLSPSFGHFNLLGCLKSERKSVNNELFIDVFLIQLSNFLSPSFDCIKIANKSSAYNIPKGI